MFSFVCWAVPNNVPVNQLFGVRSGLGLSVLTFDWTQISWIGSPLMGMVILIGKNLYLTHGLIVVPWWAQVHIFLGFILFFWILTPALYYSNVCSLNRGQFSYTLYFPSPSPGHWHTFLYPVTSHTTVMAKPTISPVCSHATIASTRLRMKATHPFISPPHMP